MKKIIFLTGAFLLGSIVVSAQADVEAAKAMQSGEKVETKAPAATKATVTDNAKAADVANPDADQKAPAHMKKVLAEREKKAAAIRARKKAEAANKKLEKKAKSETETKRDAQKRERLKKDGLVDN